MCLKILNSCQLNCDLRSKDFGKLVHDNDKLSDHVKFRLWLARQLALKKYQETWA